MDTSVNPDLEYVTEAGELIPVTALYIRNIPKQLTKKDITLRLQSMYGGQVLEVTVKTSRQKYDGIRVKVAVVQFDSPETATAVLRQSKFWSVGQPIIAVPANGQTKRTHEYSNQSRLWTSLNEDCLHHICQYLSFWDMVHIAKTSPKLAAFAGVSNVFAKSAQNCLMFTCYNRTDKSPKYTLQEFSDAMKFLGPHLTHLCVSGMRLANSMDGEYAMLAILRRCRRLKCLRLDSMSLNAHGNRLPMDGHPHPQLEELCVTSCQYLDDNWFTFIGKLSGLRRLVITHCLQYMPMKSTALKSLDRCRLRELCVTDITADHLVILRMITASRQTLRTLSFEFTRPDINALFYKVVAPQLANLETMTVCPFDSLKMRVPVLAAHRRVRKLIVRNFDTATMQWMSSLASGPNCVEHIVLANMSMSEPLCDMITVFGRNIRVLVLHQLDVCNTKQVADICKQLPRLQTLSVVLSQVYLEQLLVTAVEECSELSRIDVINTEGVGKLSVELVVEALRASATTADGKRRLHLQFSGCREFDSVQSITKKDKLLQDSADILELVVEPKQTFRNGIAFLPVEDYMLLPFETVKYGVYNLHGVYNERDELENSWSDYAAAYPAQYCAGDIGYDNELGRVVNANGLQIGSAFLDMIMKGM